MIRVVRSELVRLFRPRLLLGWFGLTALFAVMVNMIMFSVATQQSSAPTGPGVGFPSADVLASADGVVAGLSAAASMFGVVTLALWAIAGANDYQTGLMRLLASAQPRRSKLVVGKAIALALTTATAATVALILCIMVAPVAAQGAGISTDAWGSDGSIVISAWLNAYAAMLVWGAIGLTLAIVFRSSAVAISIGVGYVLVVESVIGLALDNPNWLLGSTMQALAAGGNAATSYSSAALLAAVYILVSMTVATLVTSRRDITV
jgi:ABC-type transport system involved in multi-copper enzyme maturation permease subunit